MRIRADGFAPNPNEIIKRKNETELFAQNFSIIINNADRILDNPLYYNCTFGSAYLSLMYFKGGMIPLGVLVLLWKDGMWKDKCSHCNGDVYIIGAGGSPLSGSNTWWGICPKCTELLYGHKETFIDLWQPVIEKIKKGSNENANRGNFITTLFTMIQWSIS